MSAVAVVHGYDMGGGDFTEVTLPSGHVITIWEVAVDVGNPVIHVHRSRWEVEEGEWPNQVLNVTD